MRRTGRGCLIELHSEDVCRIGRQYYWETQAVMRLVLDMEVVDPVRLRVDVIRRTFTCTHAWCGSALQPQSSRQYNLLDAVRATP